MNKACFLYSSSVVSFGPSGLSFTKSFFFNDNSLSKAQDFSLDFLFLWESIKCSWPKKKEKVLNVDQKKKYEINLKIYNKYNSSKIIKSINILFISHNRTRFGKKKFKSILLKKSIHNFIYVSIQINKNS